MRARFYRWVIRYNHHFWPIGWMAASFSSLGLEFIWEGDTVIWTWPWVRPGARKLHGPFVSLGFSGTGEFGDVRFHSLSELEKAWDKFLEATKQTKDCSVPEFDQ